VLAAHLPRAGGLLQVRAPLLDLAARRIRSPRAIWVSGEGTDVAFSLTAKDDHYLRVEDKNATTW
jgi:hypothetical protein